MQKNTCLFIDVWEGQLEIDEAVLKENGVVGMGIRINDMSGGHHMDTNFWRQWNEAVDLIRFPYFVYNPWVDGTENYTWLLENVPPEIKTIAVDVEVRKTGYSAATYAQELAKFMELCKGRWKIIIYTAQWFLPYLSSWPKGDYWWAQYPSQEVYFEGVSTWDELKLRLDNPILDRPFNEKYIPGTLKMWQFSGDYLQLPGTLRDIDVNIFYGTEEELKRYINNTTVDDGGDTPEPQSTGLYIFDPVNYYPRPGGGPLTMPMSRITKLGDNMTNYPWSIMRPILTRLNPTNAAAVGQISAPDWGPSKGLSGDFIKWIGLVWPGRNIVKIEEVKEGLPYTTDLWGRVQGMSLDEAIKVNLYDSPHLVHYVYDYNKANGYGERAKPVYVPIMGGPWWVEMKRLVSVDSLLPKTVTIRAFPRLNVRKEPAGDSELAGYKVYNQQVKVTKVVLGKNGIWGQVDSGWVGLRHNGVNWTDWKI